MCSQRFSSYVVGSCICVCCVCCLRHLKVLRGCVANKAANRFRDVLLFVRYCSCWVVSVLLMSCALAHRIGASCCALALHWQRQSTIAEYIICHNALKHADMTQPSFCVVACYWSGLNRYWRALARVGLLGSGQLLPGVVQMCQCSTV